MGWSRVGVLADGEFPEYHLELQDYLQQQGISVLVKRKVLYNPQEVDLTQVCEILHAVVVHQPLIDTIILALLDAPLYKTHPRFL
jgi:hypothetical protein